MSKIIAHKSRPYRLLQQRVWKSTRKHGKFIKQYSVCEIIGTLLARKIVSRKCWKAFKALRKKIANHFKVKSTQLRSRVIRLRRGKRKKFFFKKKNSFLSKVKRRKKKLRFRLKRFNAFKRNNGSKKSMKLRFSKRSKFESKKLSIVPSRSLRVKKIIMALKALKSFFFILEKKHPVILNKLFRRYPSIKFAAFFSKKALNPSTSFLKNVRSILLKVRKAIRRKNKNVVEMLMAVIKRDPGFFHHNKTWHLSSQKFIHRFLEVLRMFRYRISYARRNRWLFKSQIIRRIVKDFNFFHENYANVRLRYRWLRRGTFLHPFFQNLFREKRIFSYFMRHASRGVYNKYFRSSMNFINSSGLKNKVIQNPILVKKLFFLNHRIHTFSRYMKRRKNAFSHNSQVASRLRTLTPLVDSMMISRKLFFRYYYSFRKVSLRHRDLFKPFFFRYIKYYQFDFVKRKRVLDYLKRRRFKFVQANKNVFYRDLLYILCPQKTPRKKRIESLYFKKLKERKLMKIVYGFKSNSQFYGFVRFLKRKAVVFFHFAFQYNSISANVFIGSFVPESFFSNMRTALNANFLFYQNYQPKHHFNGLLRVGDYLFFPSISNIKSRLRTIYFGEILVKDFYFNTTWKFLRNLFLNLKKTPLFSFFRKFKRSGLSLMEAFRKAPFVPKLGLTEVSSTSYKDMKKKRRAFFSDFFPWANKTNVAQNWSYNSTNKLAFVLNRNLRLLDLIAQSRDLIFKNRFVYFQRSLISSIFKVINSFFTLNSSITRLLMMHSKFLMGWKRNFFFYKNLKGISLRSLMTTRPLRRNLQKYYLGQFASGNLNFLVLWSKALQRRVRFFVSKPKLLKSNKVLDHVTKWASLFFRQERELMVKGNLNSIRTALRRKLSKRSIRSPTVNFGAIARQYSGSIDHKVRHTFKNELRALRSKRLKVFFNGIMPNVRRRFSHMGRSRRNDFFKKIVRKPLVFNSYTSSRKNNFRSSVPKSFFSTPQGRWSRNAKIIRSSGLTSQKSRRYHTDSHLSNGAKFAIKQSRRSFDSFRPKKGSFQPKPISFLKEQFKKLVTRRIELKSWFQENKVARKLFKKFRFKEFPPVLRLRGKFVKFPRFGTKRWTRWKSKLRNRGRKRFYLPSVPAFYNTLANPLTQFLLRKRYRSKLRKRRRRSMPLLVTLLRKLLIRRHLHPSQLIFLSHSRKKRKVSIKWMDYFFRKKTTHFNYLFGKYPSLLIFNQSVLFEWNSLELFLYKSKKLIFRRILFDPFRVFFSINSTGFIRLLTKTKFLSKKYR